MAFPCLRGLGTQGVRKPGERALVPAQTKMWLFPLFIQLLYESEQEIIHSKGSMNKAALHLLQCWEPSASCNAPGLAHPRAYFLGQDFKQLEMAMLGEKSS